MRPAILLLALAAALAAMPASLSAAEQDLATYCARVRDDDTLRPPPPSPALRSALASAYARLIGRPAPADLPLQLMQLRCVDGKIMACTVGANLPCGKISTARDNRGAANWCKEHPGTSPPMAATGHDALYLYRCDGDRAQIDKPNWTLDRRGFAKELWTPVN